MAGWGKLSITAPVPPVEPLIEIVEKLKAILQALVSILEALLAIANMIDDPLVALIKALVEAIQKIIDGFLKDFGGYFLYVPIRKRIAVNTFGVGDITSLGDWGTRSGIFLPPDPPIPNDNPAISKFLIAANNASGGNAGFYRTVLESLVDEGDTNRPVFTNADDFVGGLVMVMGVSDGNLLSFLDDIWLLSGLLNARDTTLKVPRPTNLKVRALTGIRSGTFDALLTWDPPESTLFPLDDLGGIVLRPERFAIMRSSNRPESMLATSVIDFIGSRTLTTGQTFYGGHTQVVYEGAYHVTSVSYLDKKIAAEADDSFYYTVAWKLKAYGPKEKMTDAAGKELEYWHLSNIVRVVPYPTMPASTPPDWSRTPSMDEVFPAFGRVLRLLSAQVDAIAAKLLSIKLLKTSYIEQLKAEIEKYETMIMSLLDAVEAMLQSLKAPKAGVYIRSFKGLGGNDFFLSDLAQSLEPGYANAPPFHEGTEYVTGCVFLVGGPTAVNSFNAIVGAILGGKGDDTKIGIRQQLEEITEAVDAADAAISKPITVKPVPVTSPVSVKRPILFSDDFTVKS